MVASWPYFLPEQSPLVVVCAESYLMYGFILYVTFSTFSLVSIVFNCSILLDNRIWPILCWKWRLNTKSIILAEKEKCTGSENKEKGREKKMSWIFGNGLLATVLFGRKQFFQLFTESQFCYYVCAVDRCARVFSMFFVCSANAFRFFLNILFKQDEHNVKTLVVPLLPT